MLRRTFSFALASAAAAHAAQPTRTSRRMLWAGSSSTYYHNFPDQVAQSLNRFGAGGPPWRSEIVGRSGDSIQVYLKPGSFKPEYGLKPGQSFLDKIRDERFDFVVLQVVTHFLTGPGGAELSQALDTYCRAIREAGGQPVYYEMGWGLEPENDRGRDLVLESARRNQVRFYAPCSEAWKRIRAARPDLELHNLPDRSHPGTLGHYLNLCTLFTALSGRKPSRIPPTYPWWGPLTAEQKVETAAKLRLAPAPTDPYLIQLPEFLRIRSAMSKTHTLDRATAVLFQRTAWQCWRDSTAKLSSKSKS